MKKARERKPAPVTLEDRLKHGNLTVAETCALRNCSKTSFYADLKAGLVSIRKIRSEKRRHRPGRAALRSRRVGRGVSFLKAAKAAPALIGNGFRVVQLCPRNFFEAINPSRCFRVGNLAEVIARRAFSARGRS